jgi:hypothetical protein
MSLSRFYKNRYIWLIIIAIISLGLVGAALAAASSAGRSITESDTTLPQTEGNGQSGVTLPPSPFVSSPRQHQEIYSPGDPMGEQMRLQAMSASKEQFNPALQGEVNRVEFWENPSSETWIWGNVEPNSTVTITTSSGDTLIGSADELGEFSMDQATDLYWGDLITVTAGLGIYPVTIIFPDMYANSDSNINQVIGHISYPNREVGIYPWWTGGISTTVLSDEDGNFWASFQEIRDTGRGHIRFIDNIQPDEVETIFHTPFYDVNPYLNVNYAHEWIEGNYDSGWQVAITLTNETGDLKATAHGETGYIPYWGGETGFATHYNVFWDGLQPDIQVLDHVYFSLERPGEVHTAEVQVGEISGELDIDDDTFVGYLDVPWLTGTVPVDCGVWVDGAPGVSAGEVDPNHGPIFCDFFDVGWDLLPGMDVGVSYYESDSDHVINVFREPAPDLRINMWGQGMPAWGNNFIMEMHYNNDGSLTAPGVTIQAAFWGMVYISDTSGFSHTGTGDPADPIIWEVGDVPVNRYGESVFYVFLQVVNPPEGGVFTSADIDTSMVYYQYDEGRLHTTWDSVISDSSESDLGLDKWSWTGDPVPGEDFVYTVRVCNNNPNSSSEVYITDTLHISTTLVNWWGQDPGWQEVLFDPHELVVKRPTISDRCSEVYINVTLDEDAEQGMDLRNDACVSAESDPFPDNDCNSSDQNVGTPNYNLHLYPNWTYGQFVPGGEIGYELGFTNGGNMPMPGTLLTTTLPQDTEFITAYTWDWYGWIPITPTLIGDGYLVWDYGTFLNGYNQNLGIRLKIDADTPVGTPLVLENHIMGDELEYRYDDNVLIFTDSVNDFGPNLRVDKHTNWWWNWEGQLQYELRILNVGTQYLISPTITDTYPLLTEVGEGDCWWNHGPILRCEIDPDNHQVIYTLDYLNPGETASAMLRANLDPDIIGNQGLEFTNQVDISDFDDIAPEDNHDEVTSYTGPDVFVRKWLKEGEVQAGRVVTYTVEFGNLNRRPWDGDPEFGSHITETLPAGMTFVKAIGYWDPANPWEPENPDGQELVWGWGTMWSEQTWTFDLVVQIDNGILPGTELLNTIEAWGDSPTDIDIDPTNNIFEYPLYTLMHRILLPFMLKNP